MKIEFDPDKRLKTLEERGLDFLDARLVLQNAIDTVPDLRFDYPEDRYVTFGRLGDRLAVIVWSPVQEGVRVISMRKANSREQQRYKNRMD